MVWVLTWIKAIVSILDQCKIAILGHDHKGVFSNKQDTCSRLEYAHAARVRQGGNYLIKTKKILVSKSLLVKKLFKMNKLLLTIVISFFYLQ